MRPRPFFPQIPVLLFHLFVNFPLGAASLPPLSKPDLESIGQRVWKNEAAGKIEGLTDWNTGEAFASLGIGHFIWYPAGPKGPFEESFPDLLNFLQSQGVSLPKWLKADAPCPWPNRTAFLADFNGARLSELRTLLASTLPQQSQFLSNRLDRALPRMLEACDPAKRKLVENNYRSLASSAAGRFALIDYVNFKGEGVSPTERYHSEGWGLLQILQKMPSGGSPEDFARAAAAVLAQRVQNAPTERHEERWLPGWTRRVQAYGKFR